MGERESLFSFVYWRLWFWWHRHFDWCICACDYCHHRFVHAAACGGSSRLRRRP